MALNKSIAFLYSFDLGNRHVDNPSQNIISVTSTMAGDFDAYNVTTESTRRKWRSTTAISAQEFIIKAEKKSNLDVFAILGHNFTDAAVVTVQANISNNFAAPPVTKVLAYNKDIMMSTIPFGGNYEYYKITILDPSNPCGFVEMGRVVGGKVLQLIDNEDITDSYSIGKKDQSDTMKTEGFFRQSNENIITRTFNASFSKIRTDLGFDTNFKNLVSMFETVKTTRPFLTILDMNSPYKFSMWGQLTDVPDESYNILDYVTIPLRIEEVF